MISEAAAPRNRRGMPPWIPRLLATIVAIIVGLYAAFHMVRRLRGLIVLLLISLFLSVALEPAVNYLAGKGWKRGLATGLMFVALVLTAGLFVGLMVPLIVDQVSLLVVRLPEYVDRLSEFLAGLGVDFSSDRIREAVSQANRDLTSFGSDVAGRIFGVGRTLLGTIFQLLTIGLFTFYMTADGPRLRRTVCSLLPPHRQREVLRIWEIAIEKTGGYFYSRSLLAGLSAAIGWAVFTVIDLPFALALALWMAVLSQFVPVVGTYLGGALPLLIALLESPGKAIAVVVYVVVYQQVENYVLAPRITARTMSLHPAVSFGSAIAGGTLLGVPGALMALPAAATVQAFVSTYLRRHEVIESPLTDDPSDGDEAPKGAQTG
ncbi:MAG: AI-2E family transporter [Actinomycetota bacterium]|nr:AI-2E family transporter [Actinomycetota bacterium]